VPIDRRSLSVDTKVHERLLAIRKTYKLRSFSAVLRFVLDIPPEERRYGVTEKLGIENLKRLYEEHKHHQANLAKTLGISRQRLHQILNKTYPEAPRRRTSHRFTYQELLNAIKKVGYDAATLASYLSCAPTTVATRMKACGILIPIEFRPFQGPPKLINRESYHKAFAAHKGCGRLMAVDLGVSVMTVWRASKRYKCPLRDSRIQ